MLTIRFRDSAVLDELLPERKARWVDEESRLLAAERVEIDIADLSFFDDPDGAIAVLQKIVSADCEAETCEINLDIETITDLAPLLVLSEIWPELSRVVQVGRVTSAARKVMHGTRIAHVMGMQSLAQDELGDIWAFPRDRRHDADTSQSLHRHLDVPRRDEVAPRLSQQVNKWIMAVTEEAACLSDHGNMVLINLITEILDNAERHSSPETHDGSWAISAFMVKNGSGDSVRFDCHLAFLSFGATFAESLRFAKGVSREHVDGYLARQSGNEANNCGVEPRSPETYATLMALQDWITADPAAEEDQRGGLGLMHVLGFVNELGGGCPAGAEPQIVIISGNSCVKCRVPYLNPANEPESLRRTMWFNAQNDPAVAPDPHFVHDLRHRFPGSVISVKFTMNEAHLKKLAEDGNNDS